MENIFQGRENCLNLIVGKGVHHSPYAKVISPPTLISDTYEVSASKPKGGGISRKGVARFILDSLE